MNVVATYEDFATMPHNLFTHQQQHQYTFYQTVNLQITVVEIKHTSNKLDKSDSDLLVDETVIKTGSKLRSIPGILNSDGTNLFNSNSSENPVSFSKAAVISENKKISDDLY